MSFNQFSVKTSICYEGKTELLDKHFSSKVQSLQLSYKFTYFVFKGKVFKYDNNFSFNAFYKKFEKDNFKEIPANAFILDYNFKKYLEHNIDKGLLSRESILQLFISTSHNREITSAILKEHSEISRKFDYSEELID